MPLLDFFIGVDILGSFWEASGLYPLHFPPIARFYLLHFPLCPSFGKPGSRPFYRLKATFLPLRTAPSIANFPTALFRASGVLIWSILASETVRLELRASRFFCWRRPAVFIASEELHSPKVHLIPLLNPFMAAGPSF